MFAKNFHLHWIAGRANILCKYVIFFQSWVWLWGSFSMLFPEIQLLVLKKIEIIFAALYLYLYELSSVFKIFKILYQT